MSQDFKDFLDLVQAMRSRQRDYFRSRHPADLVWAKELEARVDQVIKDIRETGSRPLLDEMETR